MLSQFTDKAEVVWINEVWKKTFEELADSGEARFHLFDSLIVVKLETKLPRLLEVEYDKRCAAANKAGTTITG